MKIKQAFASIRKHSRIVRMARNHTVLFSFMLIAMALMLQSQTGGCCSTPNPPSQTPTATGTLYLPRLQPPNPLWDNVTLSLSLNCFSFSWNFIFSQRLLV